MSVDLKITELIDEDLEEFFEQMVEREEAIRNGEHIDAELYEAEKTPDWATLSCEWIEKFQIYLSENGYSIVKIEGCI